MKIRGDSKQSTVSKLADILYTSLPSFKVTGLSKDMGIVKPCAKSKGKAVIFTWRKSLCRLSENLKVTEQYFTGDFIETETSREAEAMIKSSIAISEVAALPEPACIEIV